MRERLREFLERESYAEDRSTFFNDGNVVRHHNPGREEVEKFVLRTREDGCLESSVGAHFAVLWS